MKVEELIQKLFDAEQKIIKLEAAQAEQAALIAELQEALEYYASMTNGGYGFRAADALAKAKGLK